MIASNPISTWLSAAEKFRLADDSESMEMMLMRVAHHNESLLDDFDVAINIAMGAHVPELAIKLLEIFEHRSGQKFKGDFSRAEIEKELTNIIPRDGETVFRRMGLLERGHIPNRLTLSPIVKISISSRGMEIVQRRFFIQIERHFVRWEEIAAITIDTKKSYKGMGATAFPYLRKTCKISVHGRTFVFDVSGSYPDFRGTTQLLATLSHFKPITQTPR